MITTLWHCLIACIYVTVIWFWPCNMGTNNYIFSDWMWCGWNIWLSCSWIFHVWKDQWQDWCLCLWCGPAWIIIRKKTNWLWDSQGTRKLGHVGKSHLHILIVFIWFLVTILDKLHWITSQAKPKIDRGDVKDILDPSLGGKFDEVQVLRMVHAAKLCITRSARLRPKMSAVWKCHILSNM